MKVFPISSPERGVFAFEVESVFISVSSIRKVLDSCHLVDDIILRKRFSSEDDVHIRFQFADVPFVVEEMFGDNSRYWIGASGETGSKSIEELINQFELYQPPFIVRLCGEILTGRFFRDQ